MKKEIKWAYDNNQITYLKTGLTPEKGN